jgi:hypothetical protein
MLILALAWTTLAMPLPKPATWLAIAALGVIAEGALWRTALAMPGRGPGGLQWGRIEWRLLAVAVLRLAFLGVLAALLFVAVLIFAYAAAASGPSFVAADVASWAPAVDERGRILVTSIAAAGALAVAWAGVRIATAEAATVAVGAVRVLSVWRGTRGLGLPILFAAVALAAPPLILWLGSRALIGAAPLPTWTVGLEALLLTGQWLPMSVGLMAYAYDNRAVSDA